MLIVLVAIGVGQALAMVFTALLLRSAVAEISHEFTRNLAVVLTALVLANLLLGWAKWREHVVAERLGQDYVFEVRTRAFEHISAMSMTAQSQIRGGSLQLRFVNDLTALRQWVALGLARLVVAGTVVVLSISAFLILDPLLGAVLFATLAAGGATALVMGSGFDTRIREARRRRGHIAANIGEKITNMASVQAFANIKRERRRVRHLSGRLQQAMIDRASLTGLYRGAILFLVGFGVIAIVGAAGMTSTDTLAALQRITVALTLFSLLSPSLFQLGRVFEFYKSARIAHEKLQQLFERGPLIQPALVPQRMPKAFRSLHFQNVSFGSVLHRVSFEIGARDRVILQGENGTGKSTLIRLMLRLIEPTSGIITLNGTPIQQLRTGQLRRMISVVSPDLPLFNGTVESNIAYGNTKAGRDEVAAAAELCGMDVASPSSPFFLQRSVSEAGRSLSAGEKMRIVLARALVGAPQVLLLDEPDTHLDPATRRVLRTILERFEGTWLLVSHSDLAADLTDRRWNLRNQKLQHLREAVAA